MSGPWVVGGLASNIWSVAGDSAAPDVNQMLIQYFINYNTPSGWYITSAPIITANWEAPEGQQCVVPFGGGVGKVFRLGRLPVNASAQAFVNVVKPDIGPDWQLRVQLTALFPK